MLRVFFLFGFFLALIPRSGRSEDLAVVVNKTSTLHDVSWVDLAKYFKAEKSKAPGGTKIVIVMQATGRPERQTVLREIYKMNEAQYADYFVEATFTGAVPTAPKALVSGAEVKKFVAEAPGALGYILAGEADDSIKVLKIDGKAPGEAGYKLQGK